MKILFSLLLAIICANAFAIIYRHDVPEEKYRQFASQSQFNCVGEVFDFSKGVDVSGSCVLIGSRYILSAAHVFKQSETRQDTMFIFSGRTITPAIAATYSQSLRDSMKRVIFYQCVNERIGKAGNYQFRFGRRMYKGKSIRILPAYMDSATKGQYDIALIELEEPVTNTVPATLCKTFNEQGDHITIVGFGVSGNAADPEDVGPYYTKLAGQNMVDTLYGAYYNGHPTLLGFDFDHPSLKQYNLMGGSAPLPLECLCGGGDSGGGMFRQAGNNWELVGICSGSNTDISLLMKTGYYGQSGSYTRVAAFYSWITTSINEMEKSNAGNIKK